MKHEMPLAPASPVRAITRYTSVAPAPEMNAFSPFRTKSPPSATAVVRSAAASEPHDGSVRQYEPRAAIDASPGTSSLRCSSVPKVSTIHVTMLWIDKYAVVEGQPRASASNTIAASTRLSPEPPTSSRV
eukprot:Amastigsp_a844223_12.p4 type:complete len:130 gc:universal Amastigsp_a844223_12:673-284(-)